MTREMLRQQILEYSSHLPLSQAKTIPSQWYFDEEMTGLEEESVFGQGWQMAGRAMQVEQPGAFLTTKIGRESVLVIRDESGTLRAFYNVCRHRAALLLAEPCGNVSRIRCRYHGWTYDLAGRLRGTPEFEGVEDFCKEKEGLVEVAVAIWGLFVFVNPGKPSNTLEDFLAPMIQRTKDRDWSRYQFVEQRIYDLKCNWKVFVDNYLDGGYHVNYVHPSLAGILDYSSYHSILHEESSVQVSPTQDPKSGTSRDVASVRKGEALYWWFFPNLMINLYDNCMDTNLVVPIGPEGCRVVFDYYIAASPGEATEEEGRKSIEVGHQVQLEDIEICEEVQQGLRSRSFDTGRFSVRREGPGYHFHQLLARKLKEAMDC